VEERESGSRDLFAPPRFASDAACAFQRRLETFDSLYNLVCHIARVQSVSRKMRLGVIETKGINISMRNALASLALSASNSYRLFPPSRSTTIRKAEDDLPDWHETTESMWYDDVLPLSKTALAALFVVGMI